MSRDSHKDYYNRDLRDSRDRRDPQDMRHRVRDERDYRNYDKHRKRTPSREDGRRRSRSPKKDFLDDNIMREIANLPEPSELWAPHNNGAPPPPGTGFSEPIPSYTQNYQPTYSGLYDDFPPMPGPLHPPQPPEWSQIHLPPAPLPTPPAPAPPPPIIPVIEPRAPSFEDKVKKEAAIESEMRHQKLALSKQREDYMRKAGILKKELDTLKDQRNELRGDPKRSPSPDTKRFLKENTKLQLEIQNKLKTITNVVDMLNGIIGENAQEVKIESDDEPLEKPSKRRSRSPTSKKFNYVYYDPEMHWCRVCNEFPPTAKDYLNHLHSAQHHKMAAAHMEAPWHSLPPQNEGFPSYPSAPTKRTPIRGLQFFVPSTAWYCKLCDQFIGDLHCASAHLKSITHSKNYQNFVEQNPHWETDWMSDRQKAVEKCRVAAPAPAPEVPTLPPPPPPPAPAPHQPPLYAAHTITFHKDGSYTKKKDSPPSVPVEEEKKKKDKKKKSKKRKKSSSSSSDSDSSSSNSDNDTKKKKKKSAKEDEDDGRLLNEWMSSLHSGRLSSSERRLMDTLKQRMKQETGTDRVKQDAHTRNREREAERRRLEERSRNEDKRGKEDTRRNHEDRRRDDKRDLQRREREPEQSKPKKMPFIGKMPVYKSLNKARVEEQKKDETKKQEDDQKDKKRREEIDAEIQKKVAEFKEKIAKAQSERDKLSAEPIMVPMPPPGVAIPQRANSLLGAPPITLQQPPPPATMPNLPKDFQEALDIIFPSNNKSDMQEDIFPSIPGLGGFPFNPFQGMNLMPQMPPPMPQMGPIPPQMGPMPPQMGPMPPEMGQMPQMPPQMPPMGFGMNQQMFPRFDNMPQQNNNKHSNNRQQNQNRQQDNKNKNQQNKNYKQFNNRGGKNVNGEKRVKEDLAKKVEADKKNVAAKKKIEEMDDLAMLGIDASDVGSGM